MDANAQLLLGYHLLMGRANGLGGISNGNTHMPSNQHEHQLNGNQVAPTLDAATQLELNHTLHQYHLAALAPFLAMNAQVAAVSPRGNHEEELALQALHAMKNVAPSSIHGLHMGGGRSAQISSGRSVEGLPSSDPSSDVSDHAHLPPAAFANRGSPSRAYVKRHEFWKHKKKIAGLMRSPTGSDLIFPGESLPGSSPTSDDEFDSGTVQGVRNVVDEQMTLGKSKKSTGPRGFYDTSGADEGHPPGAKDELAKEWAALTTWIRMNLHQPRTTQRKVLFVGHHPTLHPVLEDVREKEEKGIEGKEGKTVKVGSKRNSNAAGLGSSSKPTKLMHVRGGVREEDDFQFVLNPDLDWSDVGHDTRIRMKTLVQETMDIFQRKYKKRKPWEWERKVQKYRPPGSGKTFSVPLGCVVRGIQEAYFIFNPEERE